MNETNFPPPSYYTTPRVQMPSMYNPEWKTARNTRGHIFNDKIDTLVKIAEELITPANSSSKGSYSGSSAFVMRPLSYVDNSINIGSHNVTSTTTGHQGSRRAHGEKEEEKDQSGLYLILGTIGLAVAAIFAYQSGSSAPKQLEAADMLRDIEDISDSITYQYQTNHKQKVFDLIHHTNELAKAKERRAMIDFALKVALFVSGTLLFSGSVAAYIGYRAGQQLIVAGLVSGLVAGCGYLFKSGFGESGDERVKRSIRADLQSLRDERVPYVLEVNETGFVLNVVLAS